MQFKWRKEINNDLADWDGHFDPIDLKEQLLRVLKPSGNLFAFCSYNLLGRWHEIFDPVFDTFQFFVWHKTNPVPKVERAFVNGNEEDDGALLGWPCPTPEEVRLILANAAPKLTPTDKIVKNGSTKGRRVVKGINKNDYTDLYCSICLTGMRCGEALFLTWDEVDLDNKVILIRPGKKNGVLWQPKTRASIRRIAIVPQLGENFARLLNKSRNNLWVFESRRGTQMSMSPPTKRLGEICDELGFKNRCVLHSLRKYWASTVAQQGMDWKMMLKMFGHSDFELILSTYYAQNDDARMVPEASKVDFGLDLDR